MGDYLNMVHLRKLIEFDFIPRLSHAEILQFFNTVDDITMSVCRPRRILKSMGQYRKKPESDLLKVASALTEQLEGP